MGLEKYHDRIKIDSDLETAFNIVKKILKQMIFQTQYLNENKKIIITKNESAMFAPAGELIVIDVTEEDEKICISITSKDLTNVGINFNRNVKTVNKLIDAIKKELEL